MAEPSLSTAVRSNLLALQSTSELIARTQGRLSTNLRVASAVDDPVAFFQAKTLTDRADDFSAKKQGIEQGVQTIAAANDAVTAITSLVKQLQGIVDSIKASTTNSVMIDLVTQFNDIRSQINFQASDASYQGTNLVNGTGSTLTVNFSNDTASILNVRSTDVRANNLGLNIANLSATTSTDLIFNRGYISAGTVLGVDTAGTVSGAATSHSSFTAVTLTVGGLTAQVLSIGNTISATYDGYSFTITITSTRSGTAILADGIAAAANAILTAGTYAVGTAIDFSVVTAGAYGSNGYNFTTIFDEISGGILRISAGAGVTITETQAVRTIGLSYATEFTARAANLTTAVETLSTRAKSLGTNIALLNARLSFTKAYVNTLTTGAGKLTLADLNEEGANLLALQTRQQLGIQSLAFAGQAEQTILTLFR